MQCDKYAYIADIIMFYSNEDHIWMHQALNQACNSSTFDEVPVGAVITDGTKLIAAAGNNPISANDPTAHAEINAIRIAAHNLDNYRLKGTTIYVTLEPCIMCMGAITRRVCATQRKVLATQRHGLRAHREGDAVAHMDVPTGPGDREYLGPQTGRP